MPLAFSISPPRSSTNAQAFQFRGHDFWLYTMPPTASHHKELLKTNNSNRRPYENKDPCVYLSATVLFCLFICASTRSGLTGFVNFTLCY